MLTDDERAALSAAIDARRLIFERLAASDPDDESKEALQQERAALDRATAKVLDQP